MPQQVIELTKNSEKKKKLERNKTHALKGNKLGANSNMYQETTPFINFICNKKRVHEIFLKSKLQIIKMKT